MIVADSFSISSFLCQRSLDSFSVSSSNNRRKKKQAAAHFRREKFMHAKFCLRCLHLAGAYTRSSRQALSAITRFFEPFDHPPDS